MALPKSKNNIIYLLGIKLSAYLNRDLDLTHRHFILICFINSVL